MMDKIIIVVANVYYGEGLFIEGIFGRQPKIEDIRNQIEAFAPCILDYALARICQYNQAASIAI